MTKSRTPEFTDYVGALAYLGKATAKATHDAWNTSIGIDETSKDISLIVATQAIATLKPDKTVQLSIKSKSGTVRERLNRYILQPRGYEADTKWMVSAPLFELPGTKGVVTIGGASLLAGDETIDADGKIVGISAEPLDKAGWTKIIGVWIKEAMDQLTGPGIPAEKQCPACLDDDWWATSSVEHLMSHLIEPAYPAELMERMMAPNAVIEDGVAKYTGDREFAEEATRRWMLNELDR